MAQECSMAAESALREDGRYEHVRPLGKGSFGFVCQARSIQTQELVAVKFLPRSEVNKYVEAEIVNHSLLRHPHVVQFREAFLTAAFICIVMEHAGLGSLHAYVRAQGGGLKEAVARWFFQQLAVAVDYCHKKGVANRDLKLENTLLQSAAGLPLPLLKVCDFGYSKQENKSAAKSKVGTLTYMAPEVLLNVTREGRYDGKVADIWSCGVMLYVMLTGRYPFDSPNKTGYISSPNDFILMLEQMVACRYVIPDHLQLSDDCKDLLRRMLLPEPHRRIRIEQILDHPWFNTNLPPEAAAMNARYLQLPPLPGVPSPEALHDMLAAAAATSAAASAATSASASSSQRSSDKSNNGSGRSSMRTQGGSGGREAPPASAADAGGGSAPEADAARMPPLEPRTMQHQQQLPEAMQMSGMHNASIQPARAEAVAAAQQQQQQGAALAAGDGGAAEAGMEVDAGSLSDGLSSFPPHEMSSQLQAYMRASQARWS